MKFLKRWGIYLAWVISVIATLGSIFSSEFLNFEPCIFCWYQRVFMFPLVIILGAAAYKNDRKIIPYIIALPILGAFVALYQTFVYYFDIPSFICGFSCSDESIKLFNFLDMSVASFLAFMAVFFLLVISYKKTKRA